MGPQLDEDRQGNFALPDEGKERQLSKIHRQEVESQWRVVLRREKLDGLKRDVERLAERHSKEVQQKDRTIQLLDEGFNHAEDQFRTSVGAHFRSIDQLVDLHDDRLLQLEQDFQARLEHLQREYEQERHFIIDHHKTDKKKIIDDVAAIEDEETRVASKDQNDKQQVIEEIKNRTLEDINGLRFILDTKIEDLEEQFELAHGEYLQKNAVRTSDCDLLTSKDSEMQGEIDQMQQKIEQLQCSIRRVKSAARQKAMQRKEANDHLFKKKTKFMGKYQNTKGRLNQFRDAQQKRLAELTKCANTCKTNLQNKCELAERVIKLIEVGEMMENDQENNLIQLDSLIDPELKKMALTQLQRDMQLQSAGVSQRSSSAVRNSFKLPTQDDSELDLVYKKFWKKYNRALLDVLGTEKKVEQLQRKNRELNDKLKRYKDGISVNDSVIKSSNPLLVVNGKVRPASDQSETPAPSQRGETRRRLTVVDANHLFSTSF